MDSLRRKREITHSERLSYLRQFVGRTGDSYLREFVGRTGDSSRSSTQIKKRAEVCPMRIFNDALSKIHKENALPLLSQARLTLIPPKSSTVQHRLLVTKSDVNKLDSKELTLQPQKSSSRIQHRLLVTKSDNSKLDHKGSTLGPPKSRSVQHRLLVIKSDSKLDSKELQNHDQNNNIEHLLDNDLHQAQQDVNKVVDKSPQAHLEVEGASEVRNILQRFPVPKNTLNNFYQLLSEELKDNSLKIQPIYKPTKLKNGITAWTCVYHIKWPVDVKVSAQDLTKKKASSLAAGKILNILVEQGKISADGSPLIYTKEEVKKISKQRQTEIHLDRHTVENMQNIIKVFDEKMRHVVQEMDYDYSVSNDEFADESVSERLAVLNSPMFLGVAKYLAREKAVLPISQYKNMFIELLRDNRCVIVKGEPGCGKSSRIPQYVLESWVNDVVAAGEFCRIAVTQPRRIAAISLSDRVSSERDEMLGHIVGYQVRLKNNFQQRTGRILYCTTGILLRHLQSDPNLTKFSHVILDEAHERDVNTDLLMNLLKRALRENDKLKLVVMSATIDTGVFSEYFDGAPVFSVPGFTYPVKRHFLEELDVNCSKTLKMSQSDTPQVIRDDVVEVINHIHNTKPEGAILVFLPGWEDLAKIQRLIGSRNDVAVYLVHSRLKDSEQHKIFSKPPPGIRKIILATNIAETSITIDDVVYVVDTGIHKDKIFDVDKGINVIDMEWISKASANQRAGRAGRCSPGESYHLYSQERYEKFPDYSSPKILNSSLTKVVLDSKVFTNNMDACEFMDSLITPPEPAAVKKAIDELKQLELLDENEKLTPLGRTLVNFQLEPSLAKAMVNGVIFKCAAPIVDIVTLFSSETEIFGSLTLTDKDAVKRVKSQFCRSSDHLALMRIYEKWSQLQDEDHYRAQKFCRDANLAPYKLDFVDKLREVHFGYVYNGLSKSMPVSDDFSDNDELVKAVLYSGTGTVLEHRNWDIVKNRLKTNVNVLVTRNNHKATITSDSVNYRRHKFPSNFLVYINETRSNIRRTTIVRECSLLPAISVLLFNNRELQLIERDSNNTTKENLVVLSLAGTKLQCLCDREQAKVLIACKEAIESSYKYLIHQVTYAGEDITDFLRNWDEILTSLDAILVKNKVE